MGGIARLLYIFAHPLAYNGDMLRYVAYGRRYYGLAPVPVTPRECWEFEAVTEGSCAPVLAGGEPGRFRSRWMWVFPPGTPHGWTGIRGKSCTVEVFHFLKVPPQLESVVTGRGWVEFPLSFRETGMILALRREVLPHLGTASVVADLLFERAMLDLSLLAARKIPGGAMPRLGESPARKVAEALRWYEERLGERPRTRDVARQAGVSVSHLRRLFHGVRGEGVNAALRHVRLRRAMELLAGTTNDMTKIAAASGFASPADFSRTFRAHVHASPTEWRERGAGRRSGWRPLRRKK